MTRAVLDPDDLDRLEHDLRAALHGRAVAFRPVPPSPAPAPAGSAPVAHRRPRLFLAVAALVLPALLLAGAVALLDGDDDGDPVADPPPAGGGPGDGVPWAVLELPDTFAVYADAGAAPEVAVPRPGIRQQSFRTQDGFLGPVVFVTTLDPYDPQTFALLGPDTGGAEVTLRGRVGYLGAWNGDGSRVASVDLLDGTALHLTALGLSDEELVAFVDGLVPRPDGTWDPPADDPNGFAEVPTEPPAPDGATWEVAYGGDGADVDLQLYADGFEARLRDRVGSTVGPLDQALVDGVVAVIGPYAANDWWVLLEPSPGRAVELRVTGDRAEVTRVLAGTHWVDRAAWNEAVPG